MSELLPCPFCGAENTDVGFIAHTDDCYLMRRYIGASSRKELGIAWNIRPIEDALRADLVEQKKLVSGLENMVDKQTKKLYERDKHLLTEGEQKEILSYIRGDYDRDNLPCWLLDLIDRAAVAKLDNA